MPGPLIPVHRVARCVFRGVSASVNIVNVLHVQGDPTAPGGFSQTEIDALANAIGTIYTTRFLSTMANTYAFGEVTCTDLSSNLGVVGVKSVVGAGTGTGTNISNGVAACITWKIAKHYRGGHPRTYIGPVAGSNLTTPTTLLAGYVTNLTTAANGFLADVNALAVAGTPYKLVTVHRQQQKQTLDPPGLSFISAAVVDNRIDTQRRRLGRDR